MSVVLVMPSRGRPERACEATEAAASRTARMDTSIVLALDADDPAIDEYRRLHRAVVSVTIVTLEPEETGDLVRATNTVSMRIARGDSSAIIGNLGDDHIIRTHRWDAMISGALASPGVAYGDDLVHGVALPTAPFMSAAFVLALGWYALPTCRHLFIDTAWRDIGIGTGTLRYLPGLTTEHMHPLVDKAAWDDGYRVANSDETTEHDRTAYEAWRDGPAADDITRCRAVL